MWPALATTIITFLATSMKGLVGRVLIALGIGAVTAIGMNALISGALSQVMSQLNTNSQIFAAMQAMGVTWFISTILSAITTRVALSALSSDAVSFWILRRGLPGA